MIGGLILIYFVGRAFYRLAERFSKSNKILYAILGVASYYGGMILGAFILGIILGLAEVDAESFNEFALGLMAVPVGILSCWLTYFLLKRNWATSKEPIPSGVLDAEMVNEEK